MKTFSVKCKDQALWGFVYASSSKWNFPSLLNWCSWITTFRKLIYHPHWNTYPVVISKFFRKKNKSYCNISVSLINRTAKNTGCSTNVGCLDLKFFRNCPIRIKMITGSHIFILFLPRVGTLCRIFYHER